MKKKLVYIAGLGVIGGSFAKKISGSDLYRASGVDKNEAHQKASGLKAEGLDCADIILLCFPPAANLAFLKKNALSFKKGAIIANCAGVQGSAMGAAAPLCLNLELSYLGAHPMAGSEKTGYHASRPDMFEGAPLILCPAPHVTPAVQAFVEAFFKSFGFGLVRVMSAREHDQNIALVSQLPHALAAALMIMQSQGSVDLAGGALKDMTRIAQFNIPLWAELFTLNKKELIAVLDNFSRTLGHFKDALDSGNTRDIADLLEESSQKHRSFLNKGLDKGEKLC